MRQREFIAALGGAAGWSLTARARAALPVVGALQRYVGNAAPPDGATFRTGLGNTGHVERQNVTVDHRWLGGQYDRLPVLTADLRLGC
jgi:putative ABC transport system substrate-binding protein